MKKIKHKVFAYITHGHHLLVFRHLYVPEAGIQVPAGTVEENERSEDAVLRNASLVVEEALIVTGHNMDPGQEKVVARAMPVPKDARNRVRLRYLKPK